jgi:hypothetical protein
MSNLIVKSTAFGFNGLYFRKATPHSVYWTDFPMAAQYFKEENEARVTMREAGIYCFEIEPAHKDNRATFTPSYVPAPRAGNPAFGAICEAAANTRL